MKTEFITNWTKEELKIYLLIFCANADFTESKIEIDFIKSKTNSDFFDRIHKEFENDNDYTSIQKLRLALDRHNYSTDSIKGILDDVKDLFMSDGTFDPLEENLLRGLNHIFIKKNSLT